MSVFDTLISVAELSQRIDDPDVVVVDCRFSLADPDQGRRDYAKGHLPGAVYAHLDSDLAGPVTADSGRHPLPAPADFAATLRGWGISRNTQVVVYDDAGGGIAARLWWMLNWMGHRAVALLDGGFAAWVESELPISDQEEVSAVGDFSGEPAAAATIDVDEVQTRLKASDEFLLVDARDAARFRGEHEPIDPIAGHVPGARNLPFNQALSSDGRFKAAAELEALWQGVGADEEGEWAVMCGSGVTACHLALSARIGGLAMPRVYVGSWSQWLKEPGRGVASGDA